MSNDENAQSDELTPSAPALAELKANKPKPTRSLPTDRVGLEKQFVILRAYAKASAAVDRAAVSNNDVSRYADIGSSSISVCNPFWNDCGLLVREGLKQRPVEAVFEYDQSADWNAERAATKLAGVLASSWFGKAMLTKLALKQSNLSDCIEFLAEECRAPVEYKDQIRLLIDYLTAAGLIVVDGTTVTKSSTSAPPLPPIVIHSNTDDPIVKEQKTDPSKGVPGNLHPFVQGLINKLPQPESEWSFKDRAKWLNTAANIFDLMYTSNEPDGLSVTLKGSTLSVDREGSS